MTTLLIADDQALVRVGLRKILESEPQTTVVGEAGDGQDAVAAARRLRPDVVLMDIRMPVLDGIEATRRIVRAQPSTRVLILTTFGLDDYVYDALRAGASGFMLKDAPPEEIAAAVRIVASGDALLAPAITRAVIEEFAAKFEASRTAGEQWFSEGIICKEVFCRSVSRSISFAICESFCLSFIVFILALLYPILIK